MSNTNIYYVYIHRKLSDNSIFYVGKGCNGRCRSTNGRNKDWWSVVFEEKGFKPSIYKCQLSEKDALMEEESLIRKLFSEGVSLTNIKYIDSDDYTEGLMIPEVDYESSCDNRVAELQTKKKTQNLEDYFELRTGETKTVNEIKKFVVDNEILGISGRKGKYMPVSKIAAYFGVPIKNIKNKKSVVGLGFKNV